MRRRDFLETGWMQNRKIGEFFAVENATNIDAGSAADPACTIVAKAVSSSSLSNVWSGYLTRNGGLPRFTLSCGRDPKAGNTGSGGAADATRRSISWMTKRENGPRLM